MKQHRSGTIGSEPRTAVRFATALMVLLLLASTSSAVDWTGAADLGGGWKWLSWFGSFNTNADPWVYHNQHAWMYSFGNTKNLWLWTQDIAWLWTSDNTYPYFFRQDNGVWLWYQKGSSNPRWFYNLITHQWTSPDTGDDNLGNNLVIKNLAVNFDRYNPGTGKAGDFIFDLSRNKVFLEFGAQVSGPTGEVKELPTFEYIVDTNADVRAIADGQVVHIGYQPGTADYEIGVNSPNSKYQIFYDHIKFPSVNSNDNVTAGTILGKPGTWGGGLGRTEIQVWQWEERRNYCPTLFFDSSLFYTYKQKIEDLVSDWEAFKGDPSIYDEENHPCPGGRYLTMAEP